MLKLFGKVRVLGHNVTFSVVPFLPSDVFQVFMAACTPFPLYPSPSPTVTAPALIVHVVIVKEHTKRQK